MHEIKYACKSLNLSSKFVRMSESRKIRDNIFKEIKIFLDLYHINVCREFDYCHIYRVLSHDPATRILRSDGV